MNFSSSHLSWYRWGIMVCMALTLVGAARTQAVPGEHFPQTRMRVLSRREARSLNDAQRRYAINEMYARHGYLFADMALRRQFLQFGWYHPVPGRTQTQIKARFNGYERRNLALLSAARGGSIMPTSGSDWTGEHYPQTRTRVLGDDEIAAMSPAQVRYAINEMYARHGLPFSNGAIRRQFLQFGWYHPVTGRTQSGAKARFNVYERANLDRLSGLRDTVG